MNASNEVKQPVIKPASSRARNVLLTAIGTLAKKDADPELQRYVNEQKHTLPGAK